jgi:hypothetical protein
MKERKTFLYGIAKKVQVTKAIQNSSFSRIHVHNVYHRASLRKIFVIIKKLNRIRSVLLGVLEIAYDTKAKCR